MRAQALLASLLAIGVRVAAQPPESPPPPCDAAETQWVCGQQTPEDLVALPGGKWVLASVYQGSGGINLIEVGTRKSTTAFPATGAKLEPDKKIYPDCPGPPTGAF